MAIWHLRSGLDRRFRAGHPWVYSNELNESPKGLPQGAPVELQDASGKFLARGYGNPSSLIAFRAVSRDPSEKHPLSAQGVLRRLEAATRFRGKLGMGTVSHRLCYGEADRLPGLVIDRYLLDRDPLTQVLVVQAHTAGADRILSELPGILEQWAEKLSDWYGVSSPDWNQTVIVFRNDIGVRKLEGLQEETRIVKEVPGLDLSDAAIRVASADGGTQEPVIFHADLIGGQKTGFFLDQVSNVQLATQRLAPRGKAGKIRILDLCCYVGQWSTQFTRVYRRAGWEVEVMAVDASAKALEFARRNIEAQGGKCETLKGDVLTDLASLTQQFDLVISDPPALIKGRKDIPAGTHAYLQLNTQVFRLLKRGAGVVSCSCSALLEESEFQKTLSKAAYRNRTGVRWIGRGSQSPDHPMLMEFSEGRYLKCWIGISDEAGISIA